MARFDSAGEAVWRAEERVFADSAEWVQAGYDLQALRVVVMQSRSNISAALEDQLELELDKAMIAARPKNGETVRILEGRRAGSYTVDQVVEDTGFTYRVAVY